MSKIDNAKGALSIIGEILAEGRAEVRKKW
jgi:hypothetical protein